MYLYCVVRQCLLVFTPKWCRVVSQSCMLLCSLWKTGIPVVHAYREEVCVYDGCVVCGYFCADRNIICGDVLENGEFIAHLHSIYNGGLSSHPPSLSPRPPVMKMHLQVWHFLIYGSMDLWVSYREKKNGELFTYLNNCSTASGTLNGGRNEKWNFCFAIAFKLWL